MDEEELKLFDEVEALTNVTADIIFYAERGISIFPAKTKYSIKDATSDFGKLARMWLEYPDAKPAIACGVKFGLVAIDTFLFIDLISSIYNLQKGDVSPITRQERNTWRLNKLSSDWQQREDFVNTMWKEFEINTKKGDLELSQEIAVSIEDTREKFGKDEELMLFQIQLNDNLKLPSFAGFYGDDSFIIDDVEKENWEYSKFLFENENNLPKPLPPKIFDYLSGNNTKKTFCLNENAEISKFLIKKNESSINNNLTVDSGNSPISINLAKKTLEELKRHKALRKLTKIFQLEHSIKSVIKRGSSNSTYEIALSDGRCVVLGGAYELRQQSKVAAKLFEAKVNLSPFSAEKWRKILDLILEAEEEVETLSESEELYSYILSYFNIDGMKDDFWNNHNVVRFDSEDKEFLVNTISNYRERGFYDCVTGITYLPLSSFVQFLNVRSGKRWTTREISTILSRYGFAYQQKSIRYTTKDGESKLRNFGRFWTSPLGYLKPQLE
ncbi:MAG: hypothetical protein AAB336_00015 [Acidobacteriota bacterium]